MKSIVHDGNGDPLLHVETPLGIVNIRVGLHDRHGRRVESISFQPNGYVGEPKVVLSGYSNTRMVEMTSDEPVEDDGDWQARVYAALDQDWDRETQPTGEQLAVIFEVIKGRPPAATTEGAQA